MKVSHRKKFLVIGSGWEQYELIKRIKEQGHFIVATHPEMNAEGFQLADTFYVKNSNDIKSHISIAEAHNIDAVITDNCDFSFYTAAIIASKLNLPFAEIQSAIYSNDKFSQRNACKKNEILQPDFYQVRNLNELKVASKKLSYPIILKPIDSRGTFGVTIIKRSNELKSAFYSAIVNSHSHTLICEKYIEGTLVTVDGFCFANGHRALAVASRKFEIGSKPITKEIIYPAEFLDTINERLLDNHEAVVNALNYRYGHTHGEYILTNKNEIYLVECTNRGGGVYTSSVILPLLTEIDINLALINQSLGINKIEAHGKSLNFMKKAAILTFLDLKVGSVIKSINIKHMQNQSYTARFRSLYSTNDMVESIEDCAKRHTMLVIKGDSVKHAKENLFKFKDALQIEYYKLS